MFKQESTRKKQNPDCFYQNSGRAYDRAFHCYEAILFEACFRCSEVCPRCAVNQLTQSTDKINSLGKNGQAFSTFLSVHRPKQYFQLLEMNVELCSGNPIQTGGRGGGALTPTKT